MSAQHTPGPWSINDWPQATSDIAIGAKGTPLIARVQLRDVSINEQKANASLIASAPDLLAALEDLIDSDDTPERNCSCHISPPCEDCVEYAGRREQLEFARAAIAEAKGEPR